MNTQIKGQQGYKKDNIFDKMNEAKNCMTNISGL